MLSLKQITAGVSSLAKSNSARSETVHALLVSIAGHVFEHGDTRIADSMVAAFKKGTDKKAVRQWLTTYAPVTFDAALGAFKFSAGKKSVSEFDEVFLMSEACIRWDSDTDNGDGAVSPLDVYARLTKLLKDAEKARTSGAREIQHADLVSDLAALAIKYKLESMLEEV